MHEVGSDIVCAFDEVGLKKAGPGDGDDDRMIMFGWASAPSLDDDGERIVQEGLNVKPLLKKGVINWNHRQDPDGILGAPLQAELRDREGFGKCLYAEMELISSRPMAKSVWKLAEDFQKSSTGRSLGMSLEGKVRSRTTKGTVTKADVFNIALTMNPKNNDAPVQALLKGMVEGDEAGVFEDRFQPPSNHDVVRSVLDTIQKAVGSGTAAGGTDQTGGAAIRKESMDSGPSDLITFNTEEELERFAGGSEDLKEICRTFGRVAGKNGGRLTKGETALYMHLTSGRDAFLCAKVLGLV